MKTTDNMRELFIEIPNNLNAAFKVVLDDQCVAIIPRKTTYSGLRLVHKTLSLNDICEHDIVCLLNNLQLIVNPTVTPGKGTRVH